MREPSILTGELTKNSVLQISFFSLKETKEKKKYSYYMKKIRQNKHLRKIT